MKIYESKLAQVPGHMFWTFCLYLIAGLILQGLFYLTTHAEDCTHTTFFIVIFLWLGQSWRFKKMRYKINEDTLIQYDFQYRTILIEQIEKVHVLERMKWISIHTPYNMVIETIDKQKYFIAPAQADLLAATLKKENPTIQFTQG